MLKWTMGCVAALAVALPAIASAAGMTSRESTLLGEMNRVRAQHALRPLRFDPRLERAARAHSRAMIASGVFTHGAFSSRMARFDVGGAAGENLAWGVGTGGSARGVVAAWLRSPEHRANLLRPGFARVGVAAVTGTFAGFRGARVVTADFAG